MTNAHRLSLLSIGILLSTGAKLEAQLPTAADSQAVMLAGAATGARDLFDSVRTRLIAKQQDPSAQSWAPQVVSLLAQAAAAKAALESDIVRCNGSPSSCHMDPSLQLLFVRAPRFEGDSAFVSVGVMKQTSITLIPVAIRTHDYVLAKHGGSWKVVRIAMISMT